MKTDVGKLILIFTGLLILLVVYLYGTRFQIVATGKDTRADAYKLDRITGKTWMVVQHKTLLVEKLE